MLPKIFTLWTGDNPMSPERRACLESISRNSGVIIEHITPDNLSELISKDSPIHPAYQHLSNVHKSDYLRAYLMHNQGGGYSDIKWCARSWESAFRRHAQAGKMITGYREPSPNGVARVGGSVETLLRINYKQIIGCGAFIATRQTLFTAKWLGRVNKILDEKHDLLQQTPGNIMGDNEGYPLEWTEIMGNVFHPLCLELRGELNYDNTIMPVFSRKYR